jgi:HK97 gp10 family phage protein
MTVVRMSVKGARELRATFDRLPRAVGTSVLTQAAVKGARPIRDAARANAPARTGLLKRAIDARVIERTPTSVEVAVSWRKGRRSRTAAFYGLFVHQGTKQRTRKGRASRASGRQRTGAFTRSGGRTGRVSRPNPFLVRAFDSHKDSAAREAKRVFQAAIRNAVRSG